MASPQLSQKLLGRFYEVLVLLRVLGQVQGDRDPAQPLQNENLRDLETAEMRRKVLCHLCIICDFEKGGPSVTAIVAEDIPSGPRYWLAANDHLPKIRKFLVEVLTLLEKQSQLSPQDARSSHCVSAHELFTKVLSFQRSRVKEYRKLLQKSIAKELGRTSRTSPPHQAANYQQWLETLKGVLEDPVDLLEVCERSYAERRSPFLHVEYDPITQQRVLEENPSRTDVRHYIGRLSTLKRASDLLTHASYEFPAMFQGFAVREVPSEARSKHPPARAKLTIDGIANRMFSGQSSEGRTFRDLLQSMDNTGGIMPRILQHYANDNWRPGTHAELILLEAMHKKQCSFYDGDKFIACSKGACFCCHHYIYNHPGGFVLPKGHNKVYLNWQLPRLPPATQGDRAFRQLDIMNMLTQEVRKAVKNKVFNQETRRWHADSSTGITLSLGFAPALQASASSELGDPVIQSENIGLIDDGNVQEVSDIDDGEDGGVAL